MNFIDYDLWCLHRVAFNFFFPFMYSVVDVIASNIFVENVFIGAHVMNCKKLYFLKKLSRSRSRYSIILLLLLLNIRLILGIGMRAYTYCTCNGLWRNIISNRHKIFYSLRLWSLIIIKYVQVRIQWNWDISFNAFHFKNCERGKIFNCETGFKC